MVNPYASFDILFILDRTEKQLNGASETEIHLLAYLSCLLSLYNKWPSSAWGYDFYCTAYGIPFSKDLSNGIVFLSEINLIKLSSSFYSITSDARQYLSELQELEQNAIRAPVIQAACSAILSLPIGIIREALVNEPSFHDKMKSGSTRLILDNSSLDNLYEQFKALSDAIGIHVSDLTIPAVIWVSYLANATQTEQAMK